MLSNEQITKFQALYKEHFGQEIGREQACEELVKLVRLMSLIYKPMTKKEYEQLQKYRKKN